MKKTRLFMAATCTIGALTLSTGSANAIAAKEKADKHLSVTAETHEKPAQVNVKKSAAVKKVNTQEIKANDPSEEGRKWLSLIIKVIKWVLELLGIGKA